MSPYFEKLVMVPWENADELKAEMMAPNKVNDKAILLMVMGVWIQQAIDSVEAAPPELFRQFGILDYAVRSQTWRIGQPTTDDIMKYIDKMRAAKKV